MLCLLAVLAYRWCAPLPIDDGDHRAPADFPELEVDVFQLMDGGIALEPDEIKGRNTWNLWAAGNEQFWDHIAREGYGLFDLLKMIDSRNRSKRFATMGLINQPGFRTAAKADKYGLWIDEVVEPENSAVDPKVFGRPTGIMGFRLFPNPAFQGKAVATWDAQKFYDDPKYAAQTDLNRPYRIGVACGACHIAFHPTRPPKDSEAPDWENLASAIGNQYIHEGRVFAHNVQPGGFFWEMLETQPRGTSDTSRIATDHINNPNAINSIFDLRSRQAVLHDEELSSESLRLPDTKQAMPVPHILKDGADSVGTAGATLRVYVNIGMYSQHWLKQHDALLGLRGQSPFSIKAAQENSVYWLATQEKFANVLRFFERLKPYRLEDAPDGNSFLTDDEAVLTRGKLVFAENCVRCHSSKRPPVGGDEVEWFRQEVVKPDFRDNNFFSDEARYSVAEIGTNAARACGSNAKAGHIWQEFSSSTYKNLPAVGEIDVWNPYEERVEQFTIQGGGPGYYRTPSLISIWSSAPFLHNNALGKYTGDPSVAGRMEAFNDAAEKLLWPEKRLDKASIWRTSRPCTFELHKDLIPHGHLLLSYIDGEYLRIGPIPEGTPVNLLANVDPLKRSELLDVVTKLVPSLRTIRQEQLDPAEAHTLLKDQVAVPLLRASACPDLVEDRGHRFGIELPDDDKRALIEFLKTL